MTAPKWWAVMLPGEYPETSELFGPYRTQDAATAAAAAWNAARPVDPDDEEYRAYALPIAPAAGLKDAT